MSALLCGELSTESSNPSLRAKRSNPWSHVKEEWIASSLSLLAMTARCSSAISRHEAPELCKNLSPPRGRGECRVPVAPAAACAVVESTRVSHHGRTGTPGIPARDGFNSLFRALPGDRAFLSPSPPRSLLLENLTPASRRQDHTTSPSASQRLSSNAQPRPPHPAPRP